VVVFDDGKLIDYQKFVVVDVVPIDRFDGFASGFAVFLIFNSDTFGEVFMEYFVVVE
jgi:hypothetical protein